ncbi:RNA helicase CrhR [archaeon HR01]|nr:RNA helicase CrhR [archaeon HR01]
MPHNSEAVIELLPKPLREAVRERFGALTEPQVEAIPKILEGRNLLLMAPTGTGKTEAALIPILARVLTGGAVQGVKILYITPLRALNRDLLERIEWWANRVDLTAAVRHGDTVERERRVQALLPPNILITTPETLQILLTAKTLRQHLRSVEAVIVDEVHELASDKRGAQLSVGLERLEKITGKPFQRVGLSATVGSPERVASFLAGVGRGVEVVRVPVSRNLSIKVEFPRPSPEDHELARYLSIPEEVAARMSLIRRLVEGHESTLVFTNTRPLAEILTNRFRAWDEAIPIGIHHGSLSKTTRVGAEQALKTGGLIGVICTSSLEMGIDVGRIELCIQYNSPREVTRLVQRIGRSGHRIGGLAKGVVIVMDSDDALESLVIARRAYSDLIEEVEVPTNSLDVIAHQLAGLLIEYFEVGTADALELFRKSYCFKDLSMDQLLRVADHLTRLGIAHLTVDGARISRPESSTRLYEYYFSNLSMIPEEKQYLVVREGTGEPVGILDEEFVAEYGSVGTRFILMGKAWEIIQAAGERIYVVPLESLEGAVPSWVGDEIPVPLEVAQEVGRIRGGAAEAFRDGRLEEWLKEFTETYMCGEGLALESLREVSEHLRMGLPVPSDRVVMVEETPEYVVVHLCGGLRANRTISRVLGSELSRRVGAPISVVQDAYRIVLRSRNIDGEMVENLLRELGQTHDWENLVKTAVESSNLFRRRLVHTARKMGVISREASILDISLEKLAESLKGSVVYEEGLNHSLQTDFAVETAGQLLKAIASGATAVVRVSVDEPTPLARLTIGRHESEIDVIATDRLQRLVANAVRGRLNSEAVTLVCSSCFQWYSRQAVRDVSQNPACGNCGSNRLGVLHEEPEAILHLLSTRGRPANRREKSIKRQILKTARLVERYGKPAVFTLASHYLDPETAEEILSRESSLGMRLIELIIEEEKKSLQRMFR